MVYSTRELRERGDGCQMNLDSTWHDPTPLISAIGSRRRCEHRAGVWQKGPVKRNIHCIYTHRTGAIRTENAKTLGCTERQRKRSMTTAANHPGYAWAVCLRKSLLVVGARKSVRGSALFALVAELAAFTRYIH